MFNLSGNNILVSGGAGKIGSAIVFAITEVGGVPIIADVNKKSLNKISSELKGKKHVIIEADLSNEYGIKDCIKKSLEACSVIHSAVHSSYPRSKNWGNTLDKLEEEDLNFDLKSQLGGAIIFSKEIINYFQESSGGNLIHISSIQGVQAPKFHHYEGTNMTSPIEYSAIKAGVISITRWLAKAYKNKNIRVNCISPGGIEDNQPISFLDSYRRDCTNIGMLDSRDVAHLVIYLLSNNSRAINGQNIIIDDGWTL